MGSLAYVVQWEYHLRRCRKSVSLTRFRSTTTIKRYRRLRARGAQSQSQDLAHARIHGAKYISDVAQLVVFVLLVLRGTQKYHTVYPLGTSHDFRPFFRHQKKRFLQESWAFIKVEEKKKNSLEGVKHTPKNIPKNRFFKKTPPSDKKFFHENRKSSFRRKNFCRMEVKFPDFAPRFFRKKFFGYFPTNQLRKETPETKPPL